jgi:hypothetical protein
VISAGVVLVGAWATRGARMLARPVGAED